MKEKRVLNIVLTVIAGLLLLNLGIMLSPVAHTAPKAQYKAVMIPRPGSADVTTVQQTLDQQSAQGWDYAGSVSVYLIFKK